MAFVNAVALPAPMYLEQSSIYHARSMRRLIRMASRGRSGVLQSGDFVVTATSPASMRVNVSAGSSGMIVVPPDPSLGAYFVYQDTAPAGGVAVPAADPTYATWHLLAVQVLDSDFLGAVLQGNLGIIQGTPSATPADPALPTDGFYVPLARIKVPANATSATDITDIRPILPANIALVSTERDIGAREWPSATLNGVGSITIPVPAGAYYPVIDIPFQIRGSAAAALQFRFNGDAGNHYLVEDLLASGSGSPALFSSVNVAQINADDVPGDTNPAFGSIRLIQANNQVYFTYHTGVGYYAPSAGPRLHVGAGVWSPGALLTSITILTNAGVLTGWANPMGYT